jgi:hypothetical protein
MSKRILLSVLISFLCIGTLSAQNADVEKSVSEWTGDVLQIIMPTAAITSTFIWKDDQNGTLQAAKTFGVALITPHILKRIINKPRPNGKFYGFPSGHTSSVFASAAFFHKRYGWQYGIPAYIIAGFTGWSRVEAGKHDYWDVAGGAIIGILSAYIFTKKYRSMALELSMASAIDSHMLKLKFSF